MAEERELKDLSMEELLQLSPRDFIECVRTTYSLYWAVGYQERAEDATIALRKMRMYCLHDRFMLNSPIGVLGKLLQNYFLKRDGISDIFDFIEVTGDYLEEIENFDARGDWEITENLSPNLLELFGKSAKTDELPDVGDWQAPAFSGLANSKPITETNLQLGSTRLSVEEMYALKPSQLVNAARDTFALNSALVNEEDQLLQNTVTFLSIKSYVLREAKQNANSVFAPLADSLQRTPEEPLAAEVNSYMDIIGVYFDDLDDALDLDNLNDDSYQIQNNMSANLRSLFDKNYNSFAEASAGEAWVAPRAPGLDNSKPIVRFTPGASNLLGSYEVIEYEDIAEEDEDEEEDDEDYDEDDEYEGEEESEEGEDEEFVPSGGMSASLMAALGLSTEGMVVETDWKPPSTTGLTADGQLISDLVDTDRVIPAKRWNE